MPRQIIESVVAEAVPLGLREIIPSTMGEPLLYPDFDVFPAVCRKYGLRLNLTTNGTFPGPRSIHEWADQLLPVASDVKVSWNGASENVYERIMPGDCGYEQSLHNLKAFVKERDAFAETGGNRCHITLQVTFMKCNLNDLEGIVRLAIELGIDRVKGHHLIVTSPQIASESILSDRSCHLQWNNLVKRLRMLVEERPTSLGRMVELVNFTEISTGFTRDKVMVGRCPFIGEEAWINQNGEYNPCCNLDAERRKLGLTQHLTPGGLANIWSSKRLREFMENFPSHPVCLKCLLKR